jgi:hypothetical protein
MRDGAARHGHVVYSEVLNGRGAGVLPRGWGITSRLS